MNSNGTLNWHILVQTRRLRKVARERFSRLSGRAFYCRALAGESSYNIAINSDMTVSCNCRDYDGSGQIGDLSRQTLEEIFAGPQADRLRRSLAAGRIPLLTCLSCPELADSSRAEGKARTTSFRVPHLGLMVENTSSCSYRCLGCYRGILSSTRRRSHMTLDDIRRVSGELALHKIETLFFFNQGDPFSAPDVRDQLRLIRSENPEISIISSTNGLLLDTDSKREAAMLMDHLYFSIDGPDEETQLRYQVGARFERVRTNLQELVRYRNDRGADSPKIEWKYVLFNWNDRPDQIEEAIRLAGDAGADSISFWPTKMPITGISWRYHLTPFFRSLGEKTWFGREVTLRSPQGCLTSTRNRK